MDQPISVISKWGNSQGIRIPARILKIAEYSLGDKVYFDVDKSGNIVLSKVSVPKEGTLEYLFKDYDEGEFDSSIIDLGDPVGEEKW